MTNDNPFQAVEWIGGIDGHLRLLDQTRLPLEMEYIDCRCVERVWQAIRELSVRGAPAIGIAAAYGVIVGMQSLSSHADRQTIDRRLQELMSYLASSRPTAVNLFWALDRMKSTYESCDPCLGFSVLQQNLLNEAHAIIQNDRDMCHAIGRNGAPLLKQVQGVLTHCNTGGLATSEYGTALSIIFTCQDQGQPLHVFVDETRPLLQGARLTAWELMSRKIDCTLICDSMAAQVMKEGRVQAVVAGADRIAANGDTANKIGTYSVALLARVHRIPFYFAAPSSTFDLAIESGEQIPIELRNSQEITHSFGKQTAPSGVNVYNPAFDVTSAELISAIVTERGVISPVTRDNIRKCLKS
jgi:methylthioribose-1-phosphate isomerase